MSTFLDQIKWNQDGLVPVVTIEVDSRRILMQAWVNREALQTTVNEGFAVYWSRSRAKLWRKGEKSGNTQRVVEVYLDCDNDSLCYEVQQAGGIACHTGRESCFFQKYEEGKWLVADPVLKDPSSIYDNQ
tara:strand:- start:459 stop:848 length:390 start_codon:yes stop_codon:yes gene_type:complete